jgi:F1F0 ATPase subunit 2
MNPTGPMGLAALAFYPLAGVALGGLYFVLVHRTARLHAAAGSAWRIIALYAVRFVLAITVFWAIAQQGAMPLLLTLAGFIVARMVVMRRMGAH